MNLTTKQRGEFWSKEFWGEENWKKWRGKVDEMNAFRKTIKGKPTLEQAIQLLLNSEESEWLETLLGHFPNEKCVCVSCQHKKTGFVNKSFTEKLEQVLSKY